MKRSIDCLHAKREKEGLCVVLCSYMIVKKKKKKIVSIAYLAHCL